MGRTGIRHVGGAKLDQAFVWNVLIALQSLDLAYTNVTEVAPLLALSCLEILHLEGTRVSDLAMLATIEGLKILQEI